MRAKPRPLFLFQTRYMASHTSNILDPPFLKTWIRPVLAPFLEAVFHYYRLSTSVHLAITMAVITNTQFAIIKSCTGDDRFGHTYSYGDMLSSVVRWPGRSASFHVYSTIWSKAVTSFGFKRELFRRLTVVMLWSFSLQLISALEVGCVSCPC